MPTTLTRYTAHELTTLYRERQVSPCEVLTEVLEALDLSQPKLNAFCCTHRENAFRQARESEARWRRAEPRSELDGVPLSIKDNINVLGLPTRFGSRATLPGEACTDDSPAVARLREAGVVLFGKTCLPDFAHKIVTDSPLTGVTRNPRNPEHTPGGSSGGAAAAVAAGIGPVALGTDGGGSIRIPAAFTGIFGFKPTFGRVPHHPRGPFALVSHAGPMTRTVADAAAMMDIITQPDPRDWYALPPGSTKFTELRPARFDALRIAFSPKLGFTEAKVDTGVESCIRNAASIFAKEGALVDEADPPDLPRCSDAHGVLWIAASALLAQNLGSRRELLDVSLRSLAAAGERLPGLGLLDALVTRGEIGGRIKEFFTAYDLIICPVFPTAAPRLDGIDGSRPLIPYFTSWCNQLGLPAASINCGTTSDGLPVGLQVVGPPHAGALVLSACLSIEELLGPALAPAAKPLSGLTRG